MTNEEDAVTRAGLRAKNGAGRQTGVAPVPEKSRNVAGLFGARCFETARSRH